jgi:hypothetical protein
VLGGSRAHGQSLGLGGAALAIVEGQEFIRAEQQRGSDMKRAEAGLL